MSLIISGVEVPVSGLTILSWRDDPRLRLRTMGQARDGRPRQVRWIRNICLHTTKGWPSHDHPQPQMLRQSPGLKRDNLSRTARFWSTSPTPAGAHLIVDFDGMVACLADLEREVAYHAGEVNEVSIGIEIYQGNDGELYEGQLDAVVTLLDALTRHFGIQRQFHAPYVGPDGTLTRLSAGHGEDVVGIYGHRDVTTNRALGDPGDLVFQHLEAAGYEKFDFQRAMDRHAWMERQHQLNLTHDARLEVDGIPRLATRDALIAAGRSHGMWVGRPGDEAGTAQVAQRMPGEDSGTNGTGAAG